VQTPIQAPALSLSVADIMSRDLIKIETGTPLRDVADILTGNFISGAPVVDAQGEVVGIVSLSDVAFMAAKDHQDLCVDDILTPAVFVIEDWATLPQLAQLLLKARIHRALVTSHKRIVGIVTTMDLLRVIPQVWTELELAR
jgi:predicted transcriptional regulator